MAGISSRVDSHTLWRLKAQSAGLGRTVPVTVPELFYNTA
jgi:hypothetical protein